MYCAAIALTKLSVLCFYRRIFTISQPLQIAIYAVGGYVIAYWIAFTVAYILQCVPVQAYWNSHIKGACVYKHGYYLGTSVPNIVCDFVLLLLPMPPLWKLHIKWSHKIAVVGIFFLGYLQVTWKTRF